MDKNMRNMAIVAGIVLIIGFIAISGLLGNETIAKKRPSFNVSEVSYKVAVGKPQTALLQESGTDTGGKTSGELTVYTDDLALVKDSREISLESGVNLVQYKDIAERIDPTSVFFHDLTFPETFVVEQNYEYDLVSTQKILEKYLDKGITVQAVEGQAAKEYTGKLLSYADGVVLETPEGIVAIPSHSKIVFPALPEGLLTKPTLVWKVFTQNQGKRNTETVYLTGGLSWRADYIAIADKDDKEISFNGWTTITNNSGTSYPDTKLKLVAGEVHRVQESPRYAETFDYALAKGAAVPAQYGREALFEYYLYTLERKTDIRNNETKQISLLSADSVPVQKELVFDAQNAPIVYYGNEGGDAKKNVDVKLKFKNSENQGLGIPLPKGIVRVYKKDNDGQLQFVGEDQIGNMKTEDEIELLLGTAFDVAGEKAQLSSEQISKNITREEYKITLENQKDAPVTVKVKERFYGTWEITKSSLPFEKKSSTLAEFNVNVPAKGKTELTYTVEYRYY